MNFILDLMLLDLASALIKPPLDRNWDFPAQRSYCGVDSPTKGTPFTARQRFRKGAGSLRACGDKSKRIPNWGVLFLPAGVNRISERPWRIPANASSFRGREPEAGISILAPGHVGGYRLLPPTEPFQHIFPLGDCDYAREAPSAENRDFQLNRGQLRRSILWPV